jgi:hypothetical protein
MQIQVTSKQAQRLRIAADREGVSISEVVRRCLNTGLADEDSLARQYERAEQLVGAFRDEAAPDLAERHDNYLAQALSAHGQPAR